jgi:hypothetical protein
LDKSLIVLSFNTPAPPAPLAWLALPPLIFPPNSLVSVVIAKFKASTPSSPGAPEMLPVPVTLIAPPLLKIGPTTGPEMTWFVPLNWTCAALGEAAASSEAREVGASPLNVQMLERSSIWRAPALRQPLFCMPMTLLPKSKRVFTYRSYSHKDLFTC